MNKIFYLARLSVRIERESFQDKQKLEEYVNTEATLLLQFVSSFPLAHLLQSSSLLIVGSIWTLTRCALICLLKEAWKREKKELKRKKAQSKTGEWEKRTKMQTKRQKNYKSDSNA